MADLLGMANFFASSPQIEPRSSHQKQIQNQDAKRDAELDQACRDFESVFLNYMLQQMRRTVPQDGLFNGGQGEELFTSMLDNETAKSIANQKGIGLASLLKQQLASGEPIKKNE